MALLRDEGRRDLSRWDDPLREEDEANPIGWRGVLWWGYGIVFLFFGVFGVWAALAPLGSGAVAQGQVQVVGRQRIVQHLERSEEHTSELQSLMRISYVVFCLTKKCKLYTSMTIIINNMN